MGFCRSCLLKQLHRGLGVSMLSLCDEDNGAMNDSLSISYLSTTNDVSVENLTGLSPSTCVTLTTYKGQTEKQKQADTADLVIAHSQSNHAQHLHVLESPVPTTPSGPYWGLTACGGTAFQRSVSHNSSSITMPSSVSCCPFTHLMGTGATLGFSGSMSVSVMMVVGLPPPIPVLPNPPKPGAFFPERSASRRACCSSFAFLRISALASRSWV
ncbi:hypothetical protein JZ751_002292 [Albula glossodonta]|uniref:Uncharacterized protein n=1 Tax=Albula glossodonta TaxID=121402 RepID=A0A8T2PA18_9TELE|nr:hypothetical protein JZ751_002292 [Albula glossodonta]